MLSQPMCRSLRGHSASNEPPAARLFHSLQMASGDIDNAANDRVLQKLEEVLNRMTRLETKVDGLQTKVDGLQTKVDGLQTKVGGLETKVDGLEEAMGTFRWALEDQYRILPVAEDDASSTHASNAWHQQVKDYYPQFVVNNTLVCCVLSSLFAKMDHGGLGTVSFERWCFAVCEHIIPRKDADVARKLGFGKDDPQNGLPLFGHLEKTYQAGCWSLMPADQSGFFVEFTIYVSDELRHETFKYRDGTVVAACPMHRSYSYYSRSNEELTFGHLHGKTIRMQKHPYARSLFVKAKMAHSRHQELPNPDDNGSKFRLVCARMNPLLLREDWRHQTDR